MAGEFVDSHFRNWAWVEGENNPADWTTKPRSAKDLRQGSFWQVGPSFLKKEVSDWPINETFCTDKLEGELVPKSNFLQQLVDDPYARQRDEAEKLCSANSHFVSEESCLNNLSIRHNEVEKLH